MNIKCKLPPLYFYLIFHELDGTDSGVDSWSLGFLGQVHRYHHHLIILLSEGLKELKLLGH